MIGNKLLPSLIPYLMRLELSKQEFQGYLEITKQMIKKIEDDRSDVPFLRRNFKVRRRVTWISTKSSRTT